MNAKPKVFIADDSIEFGKICVAALKFYGFDVIQGPNDGRQVVNLIERYCPDVALISALMPKLDGFGIMRGVALMKPIKQPKFIMMSIFHNDFFESEALSAGASLFLVKPFDYDLLAEQILCCSDLLNPKIKSEN